MSEYLNHEVTELRPARKTGLRFECYAAHLGAIVHGVDLSQPQTEAQAIQLRRGLHEHGVLFFRDQQLTAEQFLAATHVFGEPLRHNPYLPSLADFGGVEIIESGTGPKRLANESWH